MSHTDIYRNGEYLRKNPDWHVEESPWKAKQVIRMLRRNNLRPKTICDAGCGAGEVLTQLHDHLDGDCRFVGYEISPQAFAMTRTRAREGVDYKLADILQEQNVLFDLKIEEQAEGYKIGLPSSYGLGGEFLCDAIEILRQG